MQSGKAEYSSVSILINQLEQRLETRGMRLSPKQDLSTAGDVGSKQFSISTHIGEYTGCLRVIWIRQPNRLFFVCHELNIKGIK